MTCFFCGDPSAHPSTGCQYAPSVLACYACTVEFWRWFRAAQHNRALKGRDRRGGVRADFYEAAGRR